MIFQMLNNLGSTQVTVLHTTGRWISLTLLRGQKLTKVHVSYFMLVSNVNCLTKTNPILEGTSFKVSFMFAAPDGKDSRLTSQNCLMRAHVYQLCCCLIIERLQKVRDLQFQ